MKPDDVPAPVARALDCLVGLSVGDAFGETFFDPAAAPRLASRTPRAETPWRWTDDTAMAISIVRTLHALGEIDPDALAVAFAERYTAEPWRGYGSGAFTLLTRIAAGAPWRREAARLFDGQGSMGNGAAMRAAPIGAYFAGDLDRAVDQALRSAEPTHAHPDGAAGAVAIAVAASLASAPRRPDGAALLDEVIARTPAGATRDGLIAARALGLDAAPEAAAATLGTGRAVLSSDTVPFCVWVAARHLDSYEEALWTAVAPRGDRDTNAAIVGGIVVCATGVDAIPRAWRDARERLT